MNDRTNRRFAFVAMLVFCYAVPVAIAEEPEMRFSLSDGSTMVGGLDASGSTGSVLISSDLFRQPMVISTQVLFEARLNLPNRDSVAPKIFNPSTPTFAFVLVDGSQFVGTLQSWSDQSVVTETADLGRVEFPADRIVSVVEVSETSRQISSLATSRYRFRSEEGWRFFDGELVSETPGAAVVAKIDLPSRFQIRMEITCAGQADFELSLGDRSNAGAGQGGGRVDRRGGSLSRMPSERFVTRLEWLADSVALVRSNPSVSDAAVFDVTDGGGVLKLDLFFDQPAGQLAAFGGGLLLGNISLIDDDPLVRSVLTMINRGDNVDVKRFELIQWDGQLPESRRLPNRFTLLRDGTLVDEIAEQWESDRFRVDGNWHSNHDLLRMEFGRVMRPQGDCEFMLSGGGRVRGRITGAAGNGMILVLGSFGDRFSIDPSRVQRLVGNPDDAKFTRASETELVAEGVRLRGALIDGTDVGATFGWQSTISESKLGITASDGVEIRFGGPDAKSVAVLNAIWMELRSGDRLPGDLKRIDGDAVRFRSGICGEVLVSSTEISRIRLRGYDRLDRAELELLLSLPRRMKDSPPTHLLISPRGDVLRGRLLSIDAEEARMEIRGRTRMIQREKIAEIVWLDQVASKRTAVKYVVTTRVGARLGFAAAEFDGNELRGDHAVWGDCRVPSGTLQTLKFGPRGKNDQPRWNLLPVKEPRSFDSPDTD